MSGERAVESFGDDSLLSRSPLDSKFLNRTVTYNECISFYDDLASKFPLQLQMKIAGETDIGVPLHLVVISSTGKFDPVDIRKSGRRLLMINNGVGQAVKFILQSDLTFLYCNIFD